MRTSSLLVAGGSQLATKVVKTSSEGSFPISIPAGAAIVTSSRITASRLLSNQARSFLPAAIQSAPAAKAVTVPPGVGERAEAEGSDALANAASSASPAGSAQKNERVQLVIDSLQNYDLIKPIPVVVDSLADKIFTAEAPDLNLSISENSLGGALLLLKDRIASIYEEYRMKNILDPKQARRLEILQTYIGKAKRNWR